MYVFLEDILAHDLEHRKHFCTWHKKKVAKSVQCGEPDRTEVAGIGSGGLSFCYAVFVIANTATFALRLLVVTVKSSSLVYLKKTLALSSSCISPLTYCR
jgi:hypothetical protein